MEAFQLIVREGPPVTLLHGEEVTQVGLRMTLRVVKG
jgi:hypothetical protein